MKQMPIFSQCINAAAKMADVRQEAQQQQQEMPKQPDICDAAGFSEGSVAERHKMYIQYKLKFKPAAQ